MNQSYLTTRAALLLSLSRRGLGDWNRAAKPEFILAVIEVIDELVKKETDDEKSTA